MPRHHRLPCPRHHCCARERVPSSTPLPTRHLTNKPARRLPRRRLVVATASTHRRPPRHRLVAPKVRGVLCPAADSSLGQRPSTAIFPAATSVVRARRSEQHPSTPPRTCCCANKRAQPSAPPLTRRRTREQGTAANAEAPASALPARNCRARESEHHFPPRRRPVVAPESGHHRPHHRRLVVALASEHHRPPRRQRQHCASEREASSVPSLACRRANKRALSSALPPRLLRDQASQRCWGTIVRPAANAIVHPAADSSSRQRANSAVRPDADLLSHQRASTILRPAADSSSRQQTSTAIRPTADTLSRHPGNTFVPAGSCRPSPRP